jgi:PD-(D/E)XK nuclease superfamily protein
VTPKLRLSHSSIQDYLRCSRRWYLSKIEGIEAVGEIPRPLDFGSAFHAGQEAWWTVEGSPEERLLAAHQHFAAKASSDMSWEDRVLGPELLTGYACMYGDDELRMHTVPIAERKVILPVLRPDGTEDPDLEYTVVFDIVGYDREGRTVLVEHKSTSSDIRSATFWKRFDTSLQLPLQMLAAVDCGRDPQKLVLDAIRAPKMARHRATPIEKRKFRARDDQWGNKGDPLPGTRTRDESREEFAARVRDNILDDPGGFYARKEYFPDAHSLEMARYDLWSVGQQMLDVVRREGATPRNPDGCEKYASLCGFDAACWRGESLTNPTLYTVRSRR